MAEYNYRKRNKLCVITVKVINKKKAKVSDFDGINAEVTFEGRKNKALQELKSYLKNAGMFGSKLADIMIRVNSTTDVYKHSTSSYHKADLMTFNEDKKVTYLITVRYYVSRLRKEPFIWSVNQKGENILKKRVLQNTKNNLLKRLDEANKAIKEIKLEEAIYKPFVEQVFKNVNNNKDGAVPFNPPYETVVVVAPDIEALVRWEIGYDTDIRIKLKVKSILYRGKEIRLEPSSTELSESSVVSAEYLAKELTEVYNSIKGQTENNKNTSRGGKTE